jgi:hypothetical protein
MQTTLTVAVIGLVLLSLAAWFVPSRALAAGIPAGVDAALWHPLTERLNALNQALLAALQRSGQAFLSGATLEGAFVLRACLINPRTGAADLGGASSR